MEWWLLFLWFLLWSAGGVLLTQTLLRLPRREVGLVGVGLGLISVTWLVNWLSRLPGLPWASWLSAGLLFLLALVLTLRRKQDFALTILLPLPTLAMGLSLILLTGLFTLTGRGLGIFDDYQNLPTVSLMAAGDIPPHFALNPEIRFGYHYFLLLIAAQVMRLGGLAPWSALDLARGFVLALTLLLAGLWAYRLTRSLLAQWLTVWFAALSSGVRWLLLLAPAFILKPISDRITLIGSAAQSGETLAQALSEVWNIEGAGRFPFPFAFVSGINQPLIMALGGFGVIHILLLLLLLLTVGRERHVMALAIPAILLASLALSNEVVFLILYAGLGAVGLAWMLYRKTVRLPASLLSLAAVCLAALLLTMIQGGMFTEMLARRLFPKELSQSSYYEVSFQFMWPPAFISAHLGSLQLTNPAHLLIALLEIGPVVLVLPLLVVWGWKALRRQKWFEAALVASALVSLLMVFIRYEGTAGVTATTRLYGNLLILCTLYAIPLGWLWAKRKGEATKVFLGMAIGVATFAGSALLAVQFLAVRQPVYGPFVTEMDRAMFVQRWNRLESDALVFDPLAPRAPTLFGRPTRSNLTWYRHTKEWNSLLMAPDPYALQRAGFDYIYLDKDYYKEHKTLLDKECVRLIEQVDGSKQQYNGTVPDYRQLLDIRDCQ